jgi:hypothetical protein
VTAVVYQHLMMKPDGVNGKEKYIILVRKFQGHRCVDAIDATSDTHK